MRARSPTQTQATAEDSRMATSGPPGSHPRTEARSLEAVIHSGRVYRSRASRWRSLGSEASLPQRVSQAVAARSADHQAQEGS